jgi:hypothetical protein
VNVDEQGIALSRAIADGLEQHTFDLLTVWALPGDDLALA